jgi:hypothetical protein
VGEFVERDSDAIAGRLVGGEFVVAASQVLLERVPGGDRCGGPVAFESAHGSQPCFEPAVVCFDGIVGVLLEDVPGAGRELVDQSWVDRCAVGRDLDRYGGAGERTGEEGPRSFGVAAGREQDVDDLTVLIDGAV